MSTDVVFFDKIVLMLIDCATRMLLRQMSRKVFKTHRNWSIVKYCLYFRVKGAKVLNLDPVLAALTT